MPLTLGTRLGHYVVTALIRRRHSRRPFRADRRRDEDSLGEAASPQQCRSRESCTQRIEAMSGTNKAVVRRWFDEGLNEKRLEAINELFAEAYV